MVSISSIFLSKYFFIAVLVASIIISPYMIDNTDYRPWQEDPNLFVVGEKYYRTMQDVRQRRQSSNSGMIKSEESEDEIFDQDQLLKESMKQILKENQNVCLNGKDPKDMSQEQQMEEFIKGPCSPVIIIPGVAGTSLQVMIDCEKLQRESPQIFASCGWSTCSSYEFWKKKPDTEYRLWIAGVRTPMGIIMTSKKDHCFGDVIEMHRNNSETDIYKRYYDSPGLTITYHGNTPKTSSEDECGLHGIAELTDDSIIKMMTCEHKGFTFMGELLKSMGFVSGLTLQSIPYDYRRNLLSSEAPNLIRQSIDNLNYMTGKRVTLVCHSLGALHALYTLSKMDQKTKDEKIQLLMTMGGPYLGSSKAMRQNLGGDPSYLDHFLGHDLGINYYCQNKATNSAGSGVDLYPRDTYFRFENSTWMQEILERIKFEQDYNNGKKTDLTNIPLDWFPGPSNNCSNGFEGRKNECLTLLDDLREPFLKIQNSTITAKKDEINFVLDNYQVNSSLIKALYSESDIQPLNELENPGVPTIVAYGAFLQVEKTFYYEKNPMEEVIANGDFYFPEVLDQGFGDGTVLVSSAITPAIKWIYENREQKIKGIKPNQNKAYPVKLIEFCSTYKNGILLDGKNEKGEKIFTESGYFGLECECLNEGKKSSECKHSCMINDKMMVQLLGELVKIDAKSIYENGKSPLNNEALNTFLKGCKNLQSGISRK